MKKYLLIFIWCMGILLGCAWLSLGIYAVIHFHRVSSKAILILGGNAYLVYISFRYLREELGGPRVEFKQENPLTKEQHDQLRSLWK